MFFVREAAIASRLASLAGSMRIHAPVFSATVYASSEKPLVRAVAIGRQLPPTRMNCGAAWRVAVRPLMVVFALTIRIMSLLR